MSLRGQAREAQKMTGHPYRRCQIWLERHQPEVRSYVQKQKPKRGQVSYTELAGELYAKIEDPDGNLY